MIRSAPVGAALAGSLLAVLASCGSTRAVAPEPSPAAAPGSATDVEAAALNAAPTGLRLHVDGGLSIDEDRLSTASTFARGQNCHVRAMRDDRGRLRIAIASRALQGEEVVLVLDRDADGSAVEVWHRRFTDFRPRRELERLKIESGDVLLSNGSAELPLQGRFDLRVVVPSGSIPLQGRFILRAIEPAQDAPSTREKR